MEKEVDILIADFLSKGRSLHDVNAFAVMLARKSCHKIVKESLEKQTTPEGVVRT